MKTQVVFTLSINAISKSEKNEIRISECERRTSFSLCAYG